MKTTDAIDAFKNLAGLASALGVSPSAICQWGEFPPAKRQLQIAGLSDLKPEAGVWDELLGKEGVEFAKKVWCCNSAKKARARAK